MGKAGKQNPALPWAKRAGAAAKSAPKSARGRGRGEICRVSEGFVCRGRFFAKERILGQKKGQIF